MERAETAERKGGSGRNKSTESTYQINRLINEKTQNECQGNPIRPGSFAKYNIGETHNIGEMPFTYWSGNSPKWCKSHLSPRQNLQDLLSSPHHL